MDRRHSWELQLTASMSPGGHTSRVSPGGSFVHAIQLPQPLLLSVKAPDLIFLCLLILSIGYLHVFLDFSLLNT